MIQESQETYEDFARQELTERLLKGEEVKQENTAEPEPMGRPKPLYIVDLEEDEPPEEVAGDAATVGAETRV